MTLSLLAGILGASLGSFLGACAKRIPRGLSVVRGRSRCDACGETIPWYGLIPIASFIVLKGRCHACRSAIPLGTLLWEVGGGVKAVLLLLLYGPGVSAILIGAALGTAALVAVIDWEHRIIPDRVLIVGATLASVCFFLESPPDIGDRLAGVLFLPLTLAGLRSLYSRYAGVEGMGMGDVKLAAFVGFLLGIWPAFVALWLASIAGLGYDIVRRSAGGLKPSRARTTLDPRLPFGSFLSASMVLTLFSREWILEASDRWISLLQ